MSLTYKWYSQIISLNRRKFLRLCKWYMLLTSLQNCIFPSGTITICLSFIAPEKNNNLKLFLISKFIQSNYLLSAKLRFRSKCRHFMLIPLISYLVHREITKLNLMLKKTPILLKIYNHYAQSYSFAFLMQFFHSLNTTETIASLHTFHSKKARIIDV